MNVRRVRRCLAAGPVVCGLLLGCSEKETEPHIPDTIRDPSPPDGAFDVPVHPVFEWLGPEAATYYDLLLGPSPAGLEVLAESLRAAVFVPSRQLRINREFYWQVIAYNDTEAWPGPTWRFTTVNPRYVDPVTPASVLINLEKAWQARDGDQYDSLLARNYRYYPSIDEPVLPIFNREADLDATRKLFRSQSVLVTHGGLPEPYWGIRPSENPAFPADSGYRQADIQHMTFGLDWRLESGTVWTYRLPPPGQGVTGATFYLKPAWRTVSGDTVWKLVEVYDFYMPPSPDPEAPARMPDSPAAAGDPEQVAFVSWGWLKLLGARIEE